MAAWRLVVAASISAAVNRPATNFPAAAVAFSSRHHLPIRRLASHAPNRGTSIMAQQSSSSPSATKRVVLVGGGHAHVQVIKALNAHSRPSNVHVTLIDLQSSASYSGMVPGCVSKLYALHQVQIALDSLAEWSDIEFVCGKVVGLSFEENDGDKSVTVEESDENGSVVKKEVPFDVVSLDIGSTTRAFTSIPGASEYTISTRPISDLVTRIEKEEEMLKEKLNANELPDGVRVVVVGGGAAGIELSLAMRARWNDLLDSKLSITLIDSNDSLLASETPACRSALKEVLRKYNIEVRHNLVVDEVTSSHIRVSSNVEKDASEQISYTHCIWATGAEAHQLSWDIHKECGLAVSPERGWIRVNKQLQSMSHPSVFAAGDCCEIVNEEKKSPPKAGVYAVRSGPILIENLTRLLSGQELIAYEPQADFLKLLMCGDGTALGFRFGIPLYGKWVWKLKDHIDVMFMDLFDVKNLPTHSKGEEVEEKYDTSQYDAYEAKKERMKADEAAKLLLRVDDDVDYQDPWSVIRDMMANEKYKGEVLGAVGEVPSGRI
ncbi:hypothetical protein ACHAXT_010353 [Thalassiosira profunda]